MATHAFATDGQGKSEDTAGTIFGVPSPSQSHCEVGGNKGSRACQGFQGSGKGTKVTDISALPLCVFHVMKWGQRVLVTISVPGI